MKIGDIVYQQDGARIYESKIIDVIFYNHKVIYVTDSIDFDEGALVGSIFLTREDAEKARAAWQKGA